MARRRRLFLDQLCRDDAAQTLRRWRRLRAILRRMEDVFPGDCGQGPTIRVRVPRRYR